MRRSTLMFAFMRQPFLCLKLMTVFGVTVLLLSFAGCSYLKNQTDGDSLSKQDNAKVRQIDTREINGKMTQTEADLEKDALVHNIKF